MNDSKVSQGSSIGFGGLLTLIFITLKLCGVITWSWWWVLSPIWITASIVLVILGIFLVAAFFLKH